MNKILENRIKDIIRKYFKEGKADKLRSEGYKEIKTLIWRNEGFWKNYKNYINNIIKDVQSEIYKEFKEGHLLKNNDIVKSQLFKIIETTENNFNGRAKKTQSIIREALEKSYINKEDWERYARRGFEKLKLEEHHIITEIETTKAALNNLKRYNNFVDGAAENIYYRYEGPRTVRVFCIEHINRVYSLEELNSMVNQFSQPAFAFCGGYNCRHRWVPVIGKMEDNLFIHESWDKKYETASKNQKDILNKELEFARKSSKLGKKVELNQTLENKFNKDTDLIFEGEYAQLKQPTTNNINSLGRLPDSKQADLIIVDVKKPPSNMERLQGKYIKWIKEHNEKKIILLIDNNFEEIKI